eukprot:gene44251-56805_t
MWGGLPYAVGDRVLCLRSSGVWMEGTVVKKGTTEVQTAQYLRPAPGPAADAPPSRADAGTRDFESGRSSASDDRWSEVLKGWIPFLHWGDWHREHAAVAVPPSWDVAPEQPNETPVPRLVN